MQQPIYYPTRKAEIHETFKSYPGRFVRSEIINVIIEFRKVNLKEARDIKTLMPKEVEEIYKRLL